MPSSDHLQRFADDLQRRLAPDGWKVEVRAAHQPTDAELVLSHPLVPGGGHVLIDRRETLPQFARESVEAWREVRLIHDAPVRPHRRRLLGRLREKAAWPNGDEAPEVVRSIGYVLFEEGVLTEGEARWLHEAVEPDPDTDPRLHRP